MVILNSYKSLDNLCFSDFDVFEIKIDKKRKKIQLTLEGVWLIEDKRPRELGNGYININNYNSVKAEFSNSTFQRKGKASLEQIRQLKEINDHEVGDNYLKIFGFIDDGSWLVCTIEGGEVEASFAEEPSYI